jgi:hypothetical protein
VLVAVAGGFVAGIKLAQSHTGEIGTRAWPLFGTGMVPIAPRASRSGGGRSSPLTASSPLMWARLRCGAARSAMARCA